MSLFLKDRLGINKVILIYLQYNNKTIMERKILDKRSNLDYAANAFIRAYIDEGKSDKRKEVHENKKLHISLERKKTLHLKMCMP